MNKFSSSYLTPHLIGRLSSFMVRGQTSQASLTSHLVEEDRVIKEKSLDFHF